MNPQHTMTEAEILAWALSFSRPKLRAVVKGGAMSITGKPKPSKPHVSNCIEGPHHFVIETPNGATSKGVCRKCSEEREFANSGGESPFSENHAWRG